MKLTIVTHYPADDTNFSGDYYAVTIELAGERIAAFGDYYDDKGDVRAESFVAGINYARKLTGERKASVRYENRGDGDNFV